MRALPLLLFLAALAAAPVDPAAAQVRRCVDDAGRVIYTDRRCDTLGAVERAAPAVPVGASHRGRCARTYDDLVFELESAILAGDANRLLALYHWTGLSTAQAYAVVPRLDAIARRPLVDVVPVMPSAPGVDDYYPQTTVRRDPVAIRIEQTLANGTTPARA
ncbi:MAG TPA: DUF4124 domain-containing protein, partial [Lysobacter sp.]